MTLFVTRKGLGDAAVREEWREVTGLSGYEVSNLGGVRSMRGKAPARIQPRPNPDGYPIVTVSIDGRRYTRKVHRLVALAFHGDSRTQLHFEVAHLDGDRANARADNLAWVSKVENHSHKRAHGTHQSGDLAGNRKLSSAQVVEIRERGATARELAGHYGVSRYAIYDIWQGKNWSFDQAQGCRE